jgi:hypothetical protein
MAVRRRIAAVLLLLALAPPLPVLAEETAREGSPLVVGERGILAALEELFAVFRLVLTKGGGSMDPDGSSLPPRQEPATTDGGGSMDPDG